MGPFVLCQDVATSSLPSASSSAAYRYPNSWTPKTTTTRAGVLLSGGLDSSLVASIVARKIRSEGSVWGKLHSFCVGLEGSPDLKVGRRGGD